MTYLVVKAIHILVAILWIGGLFLISFINSDSGMSSKQLIRGARITEAAIGLTWLFGVVLIFLGGWYYSSWLYLKVFLVVLISAIHTFAHRRWKQENPEITSEYLSYSVVMLSLLVLLVVQLKWPG